MCGRVILFLVQERGTPLQMEICVTFTKGNWCPASRQKVGEQKAPPVSAVSSLSSAQNYPLATVAPLGMTYSDPLHQYFPNVFFLFLKF